ncbi:hypothetical protein HYE59_07475 [Aggregatibacter actinomycetemcomitans]|nr:hypothetical protein [Aggregatibacter actinomycetemcomitans]MBN6077374.1 hypothetical protein [Aggregatibacter actinomycetemcomitans]
MTTIKLLKPHTHQGAQYQAGDVITVAQPDAEFIVKHNIGEVVKMTRNKQEGEQ